MFGIKTLVSKIRAGLLTTVQIDGTQHILAEAKGVKSNSKGCSGVINNAVQFNLKYTKQDKWHLFDLTLRNTSDATLVLDDIIFFTHADANQDDSYPQRNVFGFNDSLCNQNYVEKCTDNGGKHTSKPMALIYELDAPKTFFAGQMTFYTNDVEYRCTFNRKNNALKELKCSIPCNIYKFKPGEEIKLDQIAILDTTNISPRDALYSWADAVSAVHKPNIPKNIPAGFLCGWLISTKCEKTDSQIERYIAASTQLKKLGLEYAWTSIDNIKDGCPGNWLQSNTDNFHEGVPKFIKKITDAGFKPGLWFGSFIMIENTHDFEKSKPFLQKNENGELASRGRWWPWSVQDENGQFPEVFSLDSDNPKAADYIYDIFETYAKWGVRYYMIDFIEQGFHKPGVQHTTFAKQSYRKLLRGIQKHTAPGTFVISATGTSMTNIGAFSSVRIGMDYGESRQLEPAFPSYPANYIINGSFGSAGSPNRNAIQNLAMWGFAHDRFFQCNSNMMTVDEPIPLHEAIISASLYGISPSPVFFQDDFERMSPERFVLLKKVLPRCPGMPEAIDLFTKTDAIKNPVRIFKLPIKTKWGEWTICAIFNLNDTFRKVTLNAAELGLNPDGKYWMYDFWDENYMGTFQKSQNVEVPGMTCKVFRFAEKLNHPWILSTDMHVRQGEAELQNVVWDEEKMVLSGTAKRAEGERGSIFVVSPDTWMEKHFNKGFFVAKSALDNALIIKVPITFSSDTQKWKVEFTPCNYTIKDRGDEDI